MELDEFKNLYNASNSLKDIISSINNNFAKKLFYTLVYKRCESIKMIDYKKVDGEVYLTYLPIGKEPVYKDGFLTSKNRQSGKVGKIIKTFLNQCGEDSFSDRDLELFVNEFKSKCINNLTFKLVSGEDIVYYYNEDRYLSQNGSLGKSCMRYKEKEEYIRFYSECEGCEMLIMFDTTFSNTLIVGRALIWNYNGKKYMDRRYGLSEIYERSFIYYAEYQKWNYKEFNTHDSDCCKDFMVYKDGTYISEKVSLIFEHYNSSDCNFPYCDTLKYYQGNKISNDIKLLDLGKVFIMEDTDGTLFSHGYNSRCEHCGELVFSYRDRKYCDKCGVFDCFTGEEILKSDSIPAICGNRIVYSCKNNLEYNFNSFTYNDKKFYYYVHVCYRDGSDRVEVVPGIFIHKNLLK